MTNREVLERCRELRLEIIDIEKQMMLAMPSGAPSGVHAQQYSSDQRGTNDSQSAAMQLCDGLEQRLAQVRAELDQASLQAWRIIKWTPWLSPRDVVILDHYYILGQTDNQIADGQELARETVNRRRNALIEKI